MAASALKLQISGESIVLIGSFRVKTEKYFRRIFDIVDKDKNGTLSFRVSFIVNLLLYIKYWDCGAESVIFQQSIIFYSL